MTAELFRLIAAHVFIQACMAGIRMAAPLLALREGHSPAAVGGLLALFALMAVFLALPAGRFADRRGLRHPVRLSVIASFIGAGLAVVWPVYPVLCLSALLTGGATATASISLQRHVGRAAETPTQLKQVFSWLAMGPAISNFVGPFFAGLLIDHAGTTAGDTTGYRAAFLLMALLPLASWWWVHSVKELPPVNRAGGSTSTRTWDLLHDRMFRRLLIVNWFLSSCWDVHTFVVPVLGHERGLSASAIGTILGAFAMAAALIRLALPVIAEHLREWAVISGSMLITAALFCVYPFLHTGIAMGVCSVGLGLALGCVQPMVMSMLHQLTPEARHGEALGLRLMLINACSVGMPLVFGAVGAAVGVSAVFWGVGAVVGLGTRLAWTLRTAQEPAGATGSSSL